MRHKFHREDDPGEGGENKYHKILIEKHETGPQKIWDFLKNVLILSLKLG